MAYFSAQITKEARGMVVPSTDGDATTVVIHADQGMATSIAFTVDDTATAGALFLRLAAALLDPKGSK